MEFNNNLPIYIQIMNYIKSKIVTEEIKPGDKLPSVRELSSQLKVNPNTIQRTYSELEREGVTYTQRGMGTFVIEENNLIYNLKKNMAKDIIQKFIGDMRSIGFSNKEILEVISQFLEDK
ncbi:GntR family transcriptional regulator [Hathewaya histolytica]|uniref:Transcriptional regulator n=1 Tax=Hathewaya histolytica TaxID=1498 RepID=A0A4U9QVN1_HATHI|nr:GntR family transcriptional regulator [Hathewaya histolytica]VTQ82429.1 transcriptional regulator [Hathewaya histolytica]